VTARAVPPGRPMARSCMGPRAEEGTPLAESGHSGSSDRLSPRDSLLIRASALGLTCSALIKKVPPSASRRGAQASRGERRRPVARGRMPCGRATLRDRLSLFTVTAPASRVADALHLFSKRHMSLDRDASGW